MGLRFCGWYCGVVDYTLYTHHVKLGLGGVDRAQQPHGFLDGLPGAGVVEGHGVRVGLPLLRHPGQVVGGALSVVAAARPGLLYSSLAASHNNPGPCFFGGNGTG